MSDLWGLHTAAEDDWEDPAQGGPQTLYRGIVVPSPVDLEGLAKSVGRNWTTDDEVSGKFSDPTEYRGIPSTDSHGMRGGEGPFVGVHLEGEWDGDPDSVDHDWHRVHPDENEIRLKPGTQVKVRNVNYVYPDAGWDDENILTDGPRDFHASTDGIRYAHIVEADVAEDLMRLAMPSRDAYDYAVMDSKRKADDIPEQGEFYHGSNHEHQPGDILESVSARGDQERMDYYRNSIGAPNHADWVWMYNHPGPATKYHKNVYQLEPLDEGPWVWNNIKRDDGQFRPTENDEDFPRLVSPRARVVRKLTPEEHAAAAAHMKAYYDSFRSDNSSVTARTAMPAPLPQGIHFTPFERGDETSRLIQNTYPDVTWEPGPGIAAHLPGHSAPVGHIEWLSDQDADEAEQYGEPKINPGEVAYINVDDGLRRHSIGTELFDQARRHEPRVHHSPDRTELGEKWIGYEQSRHPVMARRIAMPTYYHYTYDPNFKLDPDFKPWNHYGDPSTAGHDGRPVNKTPGLYVTPHADDKWQGIDLGHRRYRVELDGPDAEDKGDDRGSFIPGDKLNQYTVKGVTPNQYWENKHSPEAQRRKWEERDKYYARIAMPQPLPKGVFFRYHPELMWSPGVTAHLPGGKQVGSLEWYDDDHVMVDLGTRKPGEIDRISVHPDHQGNSIATSMFDFAKQYEPRLHHSDTLTEDGEGWSAYEKARHAAVTQSLVDRLHNEFHQWHKQRDRNSASYKDWAKYGDPDAGPISNWPSIESFLKDRYPAAHRGHHMGLEQAQPLLDSTMGDPDSYDPQADPRGWGRDSSGRLVPTEGVKLYDTGPDAVAQHGYDPAEIAAGMLLLHNRAHPLRADMAQEDQARLNDIFDKRVKMQRNYEQRNARLAMAWQDWAPKIQGGCKSCTHRDDGNGSHGEYWIEHEPTGDPLPGDALADGSLVSNLSFFHDVGRDGVPELYIAGIHTSSGHRNDGVAEALMRRMHEDHPNTRINPGFMTDDGQAFHDKMLSKEPDARGVVTAGRNGPPPPMTFEPFNTYWSNGIMARHAEDGRPLAHLHWYPDGEIESIRVHPEMQGRDIGKHILAHAVMNPDTYEAPHWGIQPSNHMTEAGRAYARSLGYNPPDEEVTPADNDVSQWGWTAVKDYVPLHIPYTGQNEDEMSNYLEQPWTPPQQRTASADDEGWPVWWRGRHRPAGPFDKRWHPNHPEHIPAPWDN